MGSGVGAEATGAGGLAWTPWRPPARGLPPQWGGGLPRNEQPPWNVDHERHGTSTSRWWLNQLSTESNSGQTAIDGALALAWVAPLTLRSEAPAFGTCPLRTSCAPPSGHAGWHFLGRSPLLLKSPMGGGMAASWGAVVKGPFTGP